MIRILVVDRDPMAAALIGRALQSRGWLADIADNGPTAVALTGTGRYRIVIVDVADHRLDGTGLLSGILAARPGQAVIALAAAHDAGVRALQAGAADYLARSTSIDELLARIGARLHDHSDTGASHLQSCGEVTVDLTRRTVDTGHGQIHLTQREFLLLAHLMSHQGRVFSRQELLAEVWGISFDSGSNVVDVYIRRLRSKLGRDLIETVRNVGYTLRAS